MYLNSAYPTSLLDQNTHTILDESGAQYILLQKCLGTLYKDLKKAKFTILETIKGKDLEGIEYVPLFTYFKSFAAQGAFKVLCDGYVTDESGVGVVHQSPAFGEDDYRVCLKYGIVTAGGDLPCPVDEAGRFTSQVPEFAGQNVKDTDKAIIKHLKNEKRLVRHDQINHSYPFCWRFVVDFFNRLCT